METPAPYSARPETSEPCHARTPLEGAWALLADSPRAREWPELVRWCRAVTEALAAAPAQ